MRAVVLVILAACASGRTHVRDSQGQPLPTTARFDASYAMNVRCPDGEQYLIVDAPRPYLAGLRIAGARVEVRDAPALCRAIAEN